MSDRPIHEVLAEISAKVPPEEWAKLDKTHYADPDTLATLNRLERENADLRAKLDAAERNARRYRWLRDPQNEWLLQVKPVIMHGEDMYAAEKLDSAIDAAMQEGK